MTRKIKVLIVLVFLVVIFFVFFMPSEDSASMRVNIDMCKEVVKKTGFQGRVTSVVSSNKFIRGGAAVIIAIDKLEGADAKELSACPMLIIAQNTLRIESNHRYISYSPEQRVYEGYYLKKNADNMIVRVFDEKDKYIYDFELMKGLGFPE